MITNRKIDKRTTKIKSGMYVRYYLYRHIRPDTDEPFYIGIGTKRPFYSNYQLEFSRAFSKDDRSYYWNNVVNINPNYEVEILLESDDYDFIKEKEREFIKFYGRKDLGTGILCNLTDGGEGSPNVVCSNELRIKRSILAKEKNLGKGTNRRKSEKIYQYDLEGNFIREWFSIKEASIELNMNTGSVHNSLSNPRRHTARNFVWYRTFQGEKIPKFIKHNNEGKIILMLDLQGNYLRELPSLKEAKDFIKASSHNGIMKCCKNLAKSAYGYKWRYKND